MGFIGSIFKKFFLSLLGLVVFLVLLGIANLLSLIIKNEVFVGVVDFLNVNIMLIIIIMIIFFIGDVFWSFIFPFNLPAPIISAISSIFVVVFLYKLFSLIAGFIGLDLTGISQTLIYIIYNLIFWIVLISGYLYIISKRPKTHRKVEKRLSKIEKKLDEMEILEGLKIKEHEKKPEKKKDVKKEVEKPIKETLKKPVKKSDVKKKTDKIPNKKESKGKTKKK